MKRWLVAAVVVLAGCSQAGSACEDAWAVICARACECDETSECSFGEDGVSIGSDSYEECLAQTRGLVCANPNAGMVDWGACESLASTAACNPGTGDGAATVPPECDVP